MKKISLLLSAWMLVHILPTIANAFPDMIRHGYVNCNTCHVSPTGGQMLTPYGRVLSKELLSMWGTDREAEFLHGLLPEEALDSWLIGGGNVRMMQTHRETSTEKVGRGFLMQATLELAARYKNLTAFVSVGEPDREERRIKPTPQSYYGMWTPTPELSLRVGSFIPLFGLHVPYHTLPTRGGLGFGPGSEKAGLEGVWSGDNWNLGLTIAGAQFSSAEMISMRINRNVFGTHQIGLSLLAEESEEQNRQVLSSHGSLGFRPDLAYLFEFAFQARGGATGSDTVDGLFHFSQLIYEVKQGLQFYLMEDYQQSDFGNDSTINYSFGLGTRWYPRPHFEVDLMYSKKHQPAVSDEYTDFAWLMLHYYL